MGKTQKYKIQVNSNKTYNIAVRNPPDATVGRLALIKGGCI